jgi:plastocyanin
MALSGYLLGLLFSAPDVTGAQLAGRQSGWIGSIFNQRKVLPMRFKSRFLAGVIGLAIGLSGWVAAAQAAETVVDQKNLKFVPNTVTINVGDSIRFTNGDPFTHDVTVISPDGSSSDKGLQHHGKDNVVAFPKAGTFSIVCKMHPNMKATVIVK